MYKLINFIPAPSNTNINIIILYLYNKYIFFLTPFKLNSSICMRLTIFYKRPQLNKNIEL